MSCAQKRDLSKIVKSEDGEMAVDAGAPDDPGCAASLIGYGALPDGDRALLTTPYPTNDREPQALSGSGIDLCLLSLAWHVGAQLRILARTNARTPKRQRADALTRPSAPRCKLSR